MAKLAKFLQGVAGAGGAALNVEDVFSTYLWDGAGGTQTIVNGVDLTEGGLVWAKQRSSTIKHVLSDSERGTTKVLSSNSTAAESTETNGFTSFNSDGFTFGSWAGLNNNGDSYTSWTFRKAPKFFDVVTYTGTGSAQNISHNLGSVPAVVIVKRTSSAEDWLVYHRSTGNQAGTGLNETAATYTGVSAYWNSTTPTDSVFTVGTHARVNTSGQTYVAYLFAHNDGDGDFGPTGDQDIIKCGSYTGTGSEMFIDLGFEPQWILTRRTDTTDNWFMVDTMRGIVSGGGEDYLWANTSNAEQATTAGWAVNPTGFTVESASRYASGGTYIYIAIRRGPMAVPTAATDVFDVATRGAVSGEPGFRSSTGVVDMALVKTVNTVSDWRAKSRLTQGKYLVTNSTAAEASLSYAVFDYMNGHSAFDGTNSNTHSWMWKRAPGFFDVVAYTGTGVGNRTLNHNLGVVPEMIWTKARQSTTDNSWVVYHKDVPSKRLNLDGVGTSNATNYTSLTSTSVNLADNTTNNTVDYISYFFASLSGVSKVGSVTIQSGSTTVDCGFSSGPRFVLLKRTDGASSWNLFDSERGIVAGNDPYLNLNQTAAEITGNDLIDPTSSGFTLTSLWTAGQTWIYYAIA